MKKLTLTVILLLFILGVFLLTLNSCYDDKYDKLYPTPVTTSTVTTTPLCDTTTISFSKDIQPILQSDCYDPGNGCHDAIGSSTSQYNFTTYAGVQPVATADVIVNDINGTPSRGHTAMPKNLPKIADCDIDKITRWVNEGAPNN